jgi:hypothetical protein
MQTLVICTSLTGILIGLILAAFEIERSTKRKVERSIAIFWRDKQDECSLWLTKLAINEIKREMNNQQQREEFNKETK